MKVVIVGGGTAGWWSAGCLEHNFPDWDITLVESKSIPIIGIGESTVPQIGTFLKNIGITDDEWLKTTNGIKKYGNRKIGWNKGDHVPFDWTFWWNDDNRFDGWAEKYLNGEVDRDSLNDFYDPEGWAGYAYHVDGAEMSKMVKEHCKGVRHIYGTLDEKPDADLVLDCTGFRSQFVDDPTRIVYPHTLVDSAIVGPHELIDLPPVTQSIARNYGWQFLVSLKNRIGSGYCYSSRFISDEDAEAEFKGMVKELGLTPKTEKYMKFKWDPYVLKNPWSGNVLAIGTTSGFVDPLEANALFHIQHGIETFVKCIKRGYSKETYNRAHRIAWANTVDLVKHHYALSNRDDTEFWQYWQDVDCSKSVWENYDKRKNKMTNLYPDSMWATMATYFNEFNHYKT